MWFKRKITSSKSTATDTDLLCRLVQDDAVAFTELYHRYQEKLYTLAVKFIKDEDTAQDIIQQVFMQLWENRKTLAVDVSLQNYLFTMVKNRILNLMRQENATIQKFYEYTQQRVSDETWIEREQKDALIQQLRTQLDTLPAQRRQICMMKIYEKKNNQEIADALGITVQTVKNQYSAAVKTLREKMEGKSNQDFLRLG